MSDSLFRRLFTRTSGLSLNIAANIGANLIIAGVFLVSVPLIIPYIGLEAYGLVGFFVTLQTLTAVLELGLNVTITREFAIGIQDKAHSDDLRSLLRTSEVFYFGLGIAALAVWLAVSNMLVGYLNPQGLSRDTVYRSLLLMGVPLAVQFPLSLYANGLVGIQRQALVSVISTTFSVLRNLGVIGILHYVSNRPEAYFGWHAVCGLINVPVLALALYSTIPPALNRVRLRVELLTNKWRFVTGIGVITLTSAILGNVDRLVVARMLPLETFGYYTLAATTAGGIQWLVQPVFRALFPKLSQIVSQHEQETLWLMYHRGCQLMAVVVLPVAAILIFFSWEVINLWQRNPETANNTWRLVVILVAAGAINALLFVPWALQLAFGLTRLQLIAMTASLALSIPMSIAFVSYWGSTGAAGVWLILNILLIFTTVPIAHKLLLPGETFFWATRDVIAPAMAAFAAAGLTRLVLGSADSYILTTLQLGIAYSFAAACCVAASGLARKWILQRLKPMLRGQTA
jgi:O-antigen/teichoic acid export membrane protein